MDVFDTTLLRKEFPGYRRITAVQESTSTNAELLADQLAPPLSVLLTTSQTQGRGRMGRQWIAVPGAVLACSVLLHPSARQCEAIGTLPLATGLAIVEGLRDIVWPQLGENVADHLMLKWPNDVLWSGKKICGILAEGIGFPQAPRVVTGFGINISLTEEQLPVPHATSLGLQGIETTAQDVAIATLRRLEHRLQQWGSPDPQAHQLLIEDYRKVCATLSAEVQVEAPLGNIHGVVTDIAEDGRLRVKEASGQIHEVSAGDVTHLRSAGQTYS
ncbi:biotin--[acetyl-CoA-carboxylase] ligase [Corynebacterium sp. 3HC-13]|uniref:biotin--[acetyl-CoA-carboxylase] ligase n=1 Tax=Corynebacterium poyangense TaxID=2684405 RepID=UPI001CCD4A2D|nr:biotin--[acetyl-CoA-carboxylase] ligase [Corynebacterium poyangense]MBZ8176845.1 biotin--[acetyl-CoA-carboxylase] ligase [Corynebacterium poyangense]